MRQKGASRPKKKHVLSMKAGCSPTGKKVKLETYFRDSTRDFWDLQASQLA